MIVKDPVVSTSQEIVRFLIVQRAVFDKMSQNPDEEIAEPARQRIDDIDEAISHLADGAYSRTITLLEEQRLVAQAIDMNATENDMVADDMSLKEANKATLDLLNGWLKILKKQIQS